MSYCPPLPVLDVAVVVAAAGLAAVYHHASQLVLPADKIKIYQIPNGREASRVIQSFNNSVI